MKKTKRCKSCTVQFEYTLPTAKYCSNACKCQAYSKRRRAGQTNDLNDLKTQVHSLEKQISMMMKQISIMVQDYRILQKND